MLWDWDRILRHPPLITVDVGLKLVAQALWEHVVTTTDGPPTNQPTTDDPHRPKSTPRKKTNDHNHTTDETHSPPGITILNSILELCSSHKSCKVPINRPAQLPPGPAQNSFNFIHSSLHSVSFFPFATDCLRCSYGAAPDDERLMVSDRPDSC